VDLGRGADRNAADLFSADAKTAGDQTAGLVEQGQLDRRTAPTDQGRTQVDGVYAADATCAANRGSRGGVRHRHGYHGKEAARSPVPASQRVESLGALSGGIAHDLNNVLTPILMAMPLLRTDNSAATAGTRWIRWRPASGAARPSSSRC